jgi:hypothetical protein
VLLLKLLELAQLPKSAVSNLGSSVPSAIVFRVGR